MTWAQRLPSNLTGPIPAQALLTTWRAIRTDNFVRGHSLLYDDAAVEGVLELLVQDLGFEGGAVLEDGDGGGHHGQAPVHAALRLQDAGARRTRPKVPGS